MPHSLGPTVIWSCWLRRVHEAWSEPLHLLEDERDCVGLLAWRVLDPEAFVEERRFATDAV
jgi:hypothetical protein